MVCSIMQTEVVGFSTTVGSSWIFLIVLESTYEGGVKSALGVDYASYDLISVYGFLPKDSNLRRNAGIVCGASVTYLDLTSTPFLMKK